jgi:hypothetical protein
VYKQSSRFICHVEITPKRLFSFSSFYMFFVKGIVQVEGFLWIPHSEDMIFCKDRDKLLIRIMVLQLVINNLIPLQIH